MPTALRARSSVTHVRPEYLDLLTDLKRNARDFGVALSVRAYAGTEALLCAMCLADDAVDELSSASERQQLGGAIVGLIRDPSAPVAGMPPTLHERIVQVGTALPSDDRIALAALIEEAFEVSECIRTTASLQRYARCVRREGVITVEMLLLMLGDVPAPFSEYYRKLARVGNWVDELLDVRADYGRGELALRPGVRLHATLVLGFVRYAPAALWAHPRPVRLAVSGIGFFARPWLRRLRSS